LARPETGWPVDGEPVDLDEEITKSLEVILL
jgi:hypothetical protein